MGYNVTFPPQLFTLFNNQIRLFNTAITYIIISSFSNFFVTGPFEILSSSHFKMQYILLTVVILWEHQDLFLPSTYFLPVTNLTLFSFISLIKLN